MRFLILLLFFASSVSAQPLAVTNTFENDTVADATKINQNFTDIVTGVNDTVRTYAPYNTALGFRALYYDKGAENTAGGYKALHLNTSGFQNTASGAQALYANTEGNYNTASGVRALASNKTGAFNTATGVGALYKNLVGDFNTASGVEALWGTTSGDKNTATGFHALYLNSTGSENTAVGVNALGKCNCSSNTAVGDNALAENTSGFGNTAIGDSALSLNTTGERNTAIGFQAGVDFGKGNIINATAIGYNAWVDASHKVRIGNHEVQVIQGEVNFTALSDARIKESITPVSDGLALINDLNPVSYHRINNTHSDIEMGLLAQEVKATLAKHGLGNSGMVHQPTEDAYMSLRYNDLLAPMIKAIQELDAQHIAAIDEKDEHIALLEQKLNSQQEELLAIVQSQQEQIAQLQRMMGEQFAAR